jgi:hypothetical protein
VLGEAARNLWRGVTRAPLWAGLFILTAGVCAGADVASVVALSREAHAYKDAGAAVYVIDAIGGIDGAQCAALASSADVLAAAAVTLTNRTAVFQSLPRSPVPVAVATSGLGAVLGLDDPLPAGVLLPEELGRMFAVQAGGQIALAGGQSLHVAGIYAYPDDGRRRDLGYVAIEQTAPAGVFDSCWIALWPPDQTAAAGLLRTALRPTAAEGAKLGQLNATRGSEYSPDAAFRHRAARQVWLPAALGGIILGAAAVQSRRLEFSSALHAGITRPRLVLQVLLETVAWTAAALITGSAIAAGLAFWRNPDPWRPAFLAGLRPLLACGLGVCGAAAAAAAVISENRLFKYFKEH